MLLVGLTGSIGMGKSTVAGMFRKLGIPVYDADAEIHKLYAKGGAGVEPIRSAFPDAVVDDQVDRQRLSKLVVGNDAEIERLEKVIHPLLSDGRAAFFEQAQKEGHTLVVLDIPLIFETGGEDRVHKIVVVSAPAHVQRSRVLDRPEMTEDKFEAILARQVDDAEKREKADFVIDTHRSMEETFMQIKELVEHLKDA
ncbi:dephospho-CoA kinase [Sneathiella sp. HT1-7]|jgi:dephospho-CoA kinase|uniref:dephospho-CoA kinase n=1 Tax=Sneathiella sp. HT1-7 TaxID=2887192 RepID=UPI001D157A86|nr:dephospho-CoA kinase [Sneathiella sp. HT1-7]MCC3303960.1 dephospho-CoA kinase [Sneathiella sp. HT1-7]